MAVAKIGDIAYSFALWRLVSGQLPLAASDLSTDLLNGAMLSVARPGLSGNRHLEQVVLDTTASSIIVSDADNAIAGAIWDGFAPLADFAVLDFNDSSVTGAPDGKREWGHSQLFSDWHALYMLNTAE